MGKQTNQSLPVKFDKLSQKLWKKLLVTQWIGWVISPDQIFYQYRNLKSSCMFVHFFSFLKIILKVLFCIDLNFTFVKDLKLVSSHQYSFFPQNQINNKLQNNNTLWLEGNKLAFLTRSHWINIYAYLKIFKFPYTCKVWTGCSLFTARIRWSRVGSVHVHRGWERHRHVLSRPAGPDSHHKGITLRDGRCRFPRISLVRSCWQ